MSSKKSSKSTKNSKSKNSKKKTIQSHESEHVSQMRKKFMKSEEYNEQLFIEEDDRLSFAWEDIRFHANKPACCGEGKRIDILKGLYGYCAPGSFTAIIGPSGAGKSSLLNVLSKKTTEDVEGNIYLNGHDPKDVSYKKMIGYVAQEDVVMGSMTAEEVLNFTAQLKLPDTFSDQEKTDYVETLLRSIGLYHVKDNLIGYAGTTTGARSGIKRGLSGGERKRVSICLELVANPKVLFLDEPTSGLDSFAAITVLKLLRNLAFMGRTIICTIHQPSTDMIKMFDSLILMSRGEVSYFGPLDEALPYFDSIGYHCPKFVNPSEYLLRLVQAPPSDDETDEEEEVTSSNTTEDDIARIASTFKESQHQEDILDKIEAMKQSNPPEITVQANSSNFGKQFGLLFTRNVHNILREPALFRTRIFLSLFFALITGLLWFQLKFNLTDGLERVSALFFILTTQLFGGLSGPTQIFTAERPVYYREKNSGLYGSFPYYLAKLVTEVPLNILVPIISATIGYWMINFNSSFENYLLFTLFFILVANVAHGLGMVLATSFDDSTTATKLQPIITMPLFLFSGFFVNSESIPIIFRWIEYISFFKYGFRGSANAVFRGLNLTCDYDELTNITTSLNVTVPVNISNVIVDVNTTIPYNLSICTVDSGDLILESLGLGVTDLYGDIIFLAANFVVFHFFAFLFLACCKREK